MFVLKVFGIIVGFMFFVFALTWITQGHNFFMYKFWAPKYEDVRRDVYEHTKSYRQGSIQRLNTLCLQAETTDVDHKPMLNDVISHEFAEWDRQDVPSYLASCLYKARGF